MSAFINADIYFDLKQPLGHEFYITLKISKSIL